MVQAAYTYVLLKVICFIYFTGQVHAPPPPFSAFRRIQPTIRFLGDQIFQIRGRENSSMWCLSFVPKFSPYPTHQSEQAC